MIGTVNPIGDDSRAKRIAKVAGWLAAAAVVVVALDLAGVDVGGWLSGVWNAISDVPPGYLLGAVALQTLQTAWTALAWLFILRAGYPHAHIAFAPILAAYAVGVALNAVLPANLGSFVTLFMFVAVIPGATFAGVFAGFLVQKIFFTVVGVLVYVYLFASVPGSFSVKLGAVRAHPVLAACAAAGAVVIVAVLLRVFWPKLRRSWEQAKQVGSILGSGRAYVTRVVLPSLAGYIARLLGIAVVLAAFGIPATFASVMHVVGGNSIANTISATPGGAGVNEALGVVALSHYTDAQTAAAFSAAQHLLSTGWNLVLALILVPAVFGWANGAAMIKASYTQARHHRPTPSQP